MATENLGTGGSGTSSGTMPPIGGSPAAEPKRAVRKNMLLVIVIVLSVVLIGAKFFDDMRKGTFTADAKQQAPRRPGEAAEAPAINAAMRSGVSTAQKAEELTPEQIAAAVNASPGLTAAQAVASVKQNANGTVGNQPATLAAARQGVALPSDTTTSRVIDENANTPDSLTTTRGTNPGANKQALTRPAAGARDASAQASETDAKLREATLKREQEMFSVRSSPLMAGGGGGVAASAPRGGTINAATDGSAPAADAVSDYLKALTQAGVLGDKGQGAGANALATANALTNQNLGANAQSAWLAQQKSGKVPDAVFSAPAIPGAVLLPGNVIRLVTRTTIRSDLEGEVLAQVTEDVYDSTTSRVIVIPKGAKVSGTASSDLKPGQERALVAFHTLFFPDGRSFDLRGHTGSDASGAAGLDADVDRHLFRKYGSGLLLAGLAYAVDRRNPSNQTIVLNGVASQQKQTLSDYAGQTLADTTKNYIEQQRQIPDILTVPAGQIFTIIVKTPLVLVPSKFNFPRAK